MDKYFGTYEAAKLCQVSPGSLIRWIKEGKLAASVTPGGHHRIAAKELIQLLKHSRMPVPPELEDQSRIRILIVDDEPEVRGLIRWMLERQEGNLLIEEAHDGFGAGWKARDFRPDLVILDLMMPNLDGFYVCKTIRDSADLKGTKIIVITALLDEAVRDKILSLGADDFLYKPFEIDQLKEKVMAHLYNGKGGSEDAHK